jgi:uncharacterized membrane protein YbhN (UPF0104 family)
VRPLVGLAIVGVLLARVGLEPFVAGLRLTGPLPLVVALAVTAVTTLCSAWRWRLVAERLGVALPLRAAVGACYRSQLLNSVLPGGVLGDVHRGVRHGRDSGRLGPGLRSVVWERVAGQVVLVGVTALALLLAPDPLGIPRTLVLAGLAVLLLAGALTGSAGARTAAVAEARHALLAPAVLPRVALASLVAAVGHAAVFVVAARTAGADLPLADLVPVALFVLLASGIPTNVAGWGPREGAAAWAFTAAGLGAAQGVTVSVVYGVMALVATLPGAVLLALGALPRPTVRPAGPAREPVEEAAHG